MNRRAKGKAGSRAQRKRDLLEQAARVALPEHTDVCVIGGGAAGLAAAIVAAEQGARVVVLERDPECGKSILATGNGRCNFTNAVLDPMQYNDPSFVKAACGTSWLDNILAFFQACGLAWVLEDEGRMYPRSRQAASVRNVLLQRARHAGVTLTSAREAIDARRVAGAFTIRYRECFGDEKLRSLDARRLILATGGGALGLAANLGLVVSATQPILCPLACSGFGLKAIDGRRAHASLSLMRDGNVVAHEHGEVLFRDYGISGIAAFNLSRHARAGDKLVLDLLSDMSVQEATARASHTLDGLLDPTIARELRMHAGSNEGALRTAKHLELEVLGPAEKERAQVTRGGLVNSQFCPTTLEAYDVPGLYACGEVLNVDGPCGGYNLAWAWQSGMVAGRG